MIHILIRYTYNRGGGNQWVTAQELRKVTIGPLLVFALLYHWSSSSKSWKKNRFKKWIEKEKHCKSSRRGRAALEWSRSASLWDQRGGGEALLPWQHVSLYNNSCDRDSGPLPSIDPPSAARFISPRPSHPAGPNLILHVDKNSGARASSGALGLVVGGTTPSHTDGLCKHFLRQNRGKSNRLVTWFFVGVHWVTDVHAVRHVQIIRWNMTPRLFPHVLWWLRNISLCLKKVSHSRDFDHI